MILLNDDHLGSSYTNYKIYSLEYILNLKLGLNNLSFVLYYPVKSEFRILKYRHKKLRSQAKLDYMVLCLEKRGKVL